MRLKGKVAVVTGGGTGIGEAIAKAFAQEGAAVVVTGRRKPVLEKVVREIEREGGRALAVPGSVTVEADVRAAVDATVTRNDRQDMGRDVGHLSDGDISVHAGGHPADAQAGWRLDHQHFHGRRAQGDAILPRPRLPSRQGRGRDVHQIRGPALRQGQDPVQLHLSGGSEDPGHRRVDQRPQGAGDDGRDPPAGPHGPA
ncbi:MAG: SDR family NAD(P)-dependent oxidoreductase [Nitrospirae bacterium]|nr:SDR family NAD(P)-dependent oxidoreductase [Nitrospirota bacterium]